MSNNVPKWNEEREATLTNIVGSTSPVTATVVANAAETLETTTRSVASKLRKMGFEVDSVSKNATKKYSDKQEAELSKFLEKHSGQYTYAEVASAVLGGDFSTKQIQGKILSMELTGHVKPTPKPEVVKTYSDAEETKLLGLLAKGDMFIEDIAAKMNREVNSVRGKILSLSRTNEGITIPKQKNYKAKAADALDTLGDIADLTVDEIDGAKRANKIAEAKAS